MSRESLWKKPYSPEKAADEDVRLAAHQGHAVADEPGVTRRPSCPSALAGPRRFWVSS